MRGTPNLELPPPGDIAPAYLINIWVCMNRGQR